MKVLIVDNGTRYRKQLQSLLSGNETTTIPWKKITRKKARPYDLVVLSGGHHYSIVSHPQKWKKEIRFIQESKKPILGICMGFELAASAFGAKLKRMKKKEQGIMAITWNKKSKIFPEKKFHVFENHRWVVEQTGKELLTLAQSKDGIEIFKHRRRPIWGVQFHPEMFPKKTDGKRLFERLIQEVA